MNWRLLTAINAAIALITVTAVIFGLSRTRPQRSRNVRRQNTTAAQPNSAEAKFDDKEARNRVEALSDFSNARVDDLGAVPAAELTHLMDRATPEQLAALASKFDDAPTDARTFGGMAVFFQAWAELDPNAALSGAFRVRDVAMRKLAATAVVNSVSPSEAPQLVAYLSEHPDKDLLSECKDDFLQPLVTSWSSLDPEAASKFMDALGNTKGSLNSTARENIAYNWGTLDPSAALEWVRKQADKDYINSDSLYDNVVRGWCRANLPEASAYVAQHLDDSNAATAAADVAEAMLSRDPDQAASWLRNMPDGQPKTGAESRIARVWTEKDPAGSVKWLLSLPESGQEDLVGTVVRTWAGNNWPETSRWIDTLSGTVRDYAISNAMNRDGANESDSLALAVTIRDDELRHSRIEDVIRQWAWSDSQAANEWVNNSSLLPDEKKKLLSIISETQQPATEEPAERIIIDH